eukprot:1968171-Prymnesium_polylepis.1
MFGHFLDAMGERSGCAAVEAACGEAFARSHASMLANRSTTAGSTATLCVLNESRGVLTCASVGDSFAVLLPHGIAAAEDTRTISGNHRVQDSAEERERIKACGGKIGKVRGCSATRARPAARSGNRGACGAPHTVRAPALVCAVGRSVSVRTCVGR